MITAPTMLNFSHGWLEASSVKDSDIVDNTYHNLRYICFKSSKVKKIKIVLKFATIRWLFLCKQQEEISKFQI